MAKYQVLKFSNIGQSPADESALLQIFICELVWNPEPMLP